MDQHAKKLELEDERTAQKRYTEQVHARARRPVAYTAPANTIYTQTARPKLNALPDGLLIGRVALVKPDSVLGDRADYYIGDRHLNLDGIEVYSWAAPVACTYFRGNNHHKWCEDVAVVRSFSHKAGQISDLADDVLREDAPDRPFAKRGLQVPARGGARRTPPALRRPPRPQAPAEEAVSDTTTSSEPDSAAQDPTFSAPRVRAEQLLRSRLEAPRTKSLTPVLSTLQPDQYTLVTVPAMDSIVVEGQPGTGKTIVASHRAAWMVNEEMTRETPENGLDGTVLLVGPTDEYSDHVRGVVEGLTGGTERVLVMSLPEVMRQVLGVKSDFRGQPSYTWQDVDPSLAWHADKVIETERARRGVTPTTETVYEAFRRANVRMDGADWKHYFDALPSYKEAMMLRAQAPLLAYIRWAVAPTPVLRGVEHVIVDEAQDVTGLEWLLLRSINEAEAWTLIGDMNQRRSDHSLASWNLIRELLETRHTELALHRLERGYRSTKPILEYANRLLPKGERKLLAFQQAGPSPTVTKVRSADLEDTVLSEIRRLHNAYPEGSVAAIGVEPEAVRRRLRADGWVSNRSESRWSKAGRWVTVVHPDSSRGLEFDGVVVIEPSAFPRNLGRQGPLYTALTRPNRELSVVHSIALPEALRLT